MKKIIYSAALALALSGCSSSVPDNAVVDKFLTDLSQVYLGDFAGPNPDDFMKVDFAVKRLLIDNPEAFQKQGNDLVVDAAKVHEMSDKYFDYPIAEDQSSNDVDFTKDGKYLIMPIQDGELSFSKATLKASRNDTLLYSVDVYNCSNAFKGNIYDSPEAWNSQDPDNVPSKYKKVRAVLVNKDGGLRVISYMVEN